MNSTSKPNPFPTKSFVKAVIANTIWINISEVFRYFAFVMPMMRAALPSVQNVAPMDLSVFAVWGMWDSLLVVSVTGFVWLYLERFGYGNQNAVLAGCLFWMAVFVIFWLGLFNMNLAAPRILAYALPLALAEMVVAAIIVNWIMKPTASEDA